jgi:hypothetical protein
MAPIIGGMWQHCQQLTGSHAAREACSGGGAAVAAAAAAGQEIWRPVLRGVRQHCQQLAGSLGSAREAGGGGSYAFAAAAAAAAAEVGAQWLRVPQSSSNSGVECVQVYG